MTTKLDLSVIIPALNEGPNLAILLPQLHKILDDFKISYEVLIITRELDAQTCEVAEQVGDRVVEQRERGYGGALITGFALANGSYILTMDADLSHQPTFVRDLWLKRPEAEVVIASRYVAGGSASMPLNRKLLSRVLNLFFRLGLSLPVSDLSSGFRLYHAHSVQELTLQARDFDILPEILIRVHNKGGKIQEVPFAYAPREHGSSNARVFVFGLAYLKTFWTMRKLRKSISPKK